MMAMDVWIQTLKMKKAMKYGVTEVVDDDRQRKQDEDVRSEMLSHLLCRQCREELFDWVVETPACSDRRARATAKQDAMIQEHDSDHAVEVDEELVFCCECYVARGAIWDRSTMNCQAYNWSQNIIENEEPDVDKNCKHDVHRKISECKFTKRHLLLCQIYEQTK